MKRLFKYSTWIIAPKKSYKVEETRVLELGDNVVIKEVIYRIQEEPVDGVIQVVENNPHGNPYIQVFHEGDVEELLSPDYIEF